MQEIIAYNKKISIILKEIWKKKTLKVTIWVTQPPWLVEKQQWFI